MTNKHTAYLVRLVPKRLEIWREGAWQEWSGRSEEGFGALLLDASVVTGHVISDWPASAPLDHEAIAYALEDILPRGIKYYAFLFHRYEHYILVDVIEKDALNQVRELCSEHDLRAAFAPYHALTPPEEGLVFKQLGDWWLLRAADGWGMCCNASDLPDYLGLLQLPPKVRVDGDAAWLAQHLPRNCAVESCELPWRNVPPAFDWLNYLRKSRRRQERSNPYPLFASAALLLLVFYTSSLWTHNRSLQRDVQLLEQSMRLKAGEIFPQGADLSDPAGRVAARYLELNNSIGQEWRPYLHAALPYTKAIHTLSYDGARLRIDQDSAFDATAQQKLQEQAWRVSEQSVSLELQKNKVQP